MSAVTFRKIRADEIQPGMMVARHRSHSYKRVGSTEPLARSTRIVFADTTYALSQRTLHGATWWVREVAPEHVVLTVVVDGEQDSSEVFYDDVLYRERLREVAEGAASHGYPTEVYIAQNGSVDRDPVQTFN